LSPEQCRAARGWLGWSLADLAQVAAVDIEIVRALEAQESEPNLATLSRLRAAFEAAGIGFIFIDGRVACGITYSPNPGSAH
jgi:predicted transcriptional regulator